MGGENLDGKETGHKMSLIRAYIQTALCSRLDTFGVFLFLINHSQIHVDIVYRLYVFYSILLSCLSTCSPFFSLNPVFPPAFY